MEHRSTISSADNQWICSGDLAGEEVCGEMLLLSGGSSGTEVSEESGRSIDATATATKVQFNFVTEEEEEEEEGNDVEEQVLPNSPISITNPEISILSPGRIKSRPFVSVICPTYKRRRFLPNMIKQFNYQTYPQSNMELVIIDDSPESNADIIPPQENIRYIYIPEHINLGYKRNLLNKAAIGDIIVCFDDDDYYSPERVAHAVTKLESTGAQIVGSSVIHVYYTHLDKIYELGPYGKNHATNGTFAYTRQYLANHSYIDTKSKAEEAHFTNNFTEKMPQLDPHKVMVCISHQNNTVDKVKFVKTGKLIPTKLQRFFKINDKEMISLIKNYSSLQM